MRDDVLALTSELMAIDSVNPDLVPGGAGERSIAAHVAAWAGRHGLESEVLEATPGRPSVLVRARGAGGGRDLVLCGHLDTVTVDGMTDPHTPRLEGDRLHGRGGYDMKAGVAAALLACRDAAALDLRGDVVVAAVADEEHASIGVQEAIAHLTADGARPAGAIVTEPTELELVVAHKGFVWAEIEVTGLAAHGSRPHLGVDAIVKAGPILTGLGELDAALASRTHDLLGRGSLHASTIDGGVELSSYPARCTIAVERRTLPGETGDDVDAELAALLDRCRAADPDLQVEHRITLVREPFEVDRDGALVDVVATAYEAVVGTRAQIGGASYWADAAFLQAAGIPTVMLGPVGEGAHAVQEWVSVDATTTVARTLVEVARRFCA